MSENIEEDPWKSQGCTWDTQALYEEEADGMNVSLTLVENTEDMPPVSKGYWVLPRNG